MKIIIFCSGDPRHLYFANNLCRHLPVEGVFLEEKVSIYNSERLKREADFFFGITEPDFKRTDLIRKIADINSEDIDNYLLKKDNLLVCTFGCSMIRIHNAFKNGVHILNLHSGILPQYRGVHCVFWALYNKEPDMVGGSIHFINRKIDAGNIIARVFPAISPQDDEESLFNKTIKLGTEEFIKAACFIHKYGVPQGEIQSKHGKNYLARERTENYESGLEKILKNGLLSQFRQKQRVERFYVRP